MIPWSYSRLNDFETCPKKFYETHILKSVKFDNTSPHLIKGRDFHEKLERAVKQIQEVGGGGFPKEILNTVPFIEKLWRWANAQDNGPVVSYTEQQQAFRKDLHPTGWFDGDVWVRVIWDWLLLTGDGDDNEAIPGHAVVVDWKTGKPWPDNGQLKLFAGAVMAQFPYVDTVDTVYVYVEHKKVVKERYTREQFTDIWQEFGDRSELIQLANESGQWPAKPSQIGCKRCKVTCPHAGGK